MNKVSAVLGTVLVIIAAFLFLIVFSGGSIGNIVVTGTNPAANFLAFAYVLIALPVGAGLAFYGYAVKKPVYAAGAGQQVVYKGRSGIASAALALAIIAILLGLGSIYYAGTVTPPTTSSTTLPSNLAGQLTTINQRLGSFATVNSTPGVVPFRIDWCNTDNTGQDRFCPQNIVVDQGDTVQVLFMHNDTDAHTFTILPLGTQGYSFQINLTYGAAGETTYKGPVVNGTFANGMHNFITNANFSASCSNSGTFAQESAAISATYCVSGASLLAPAGYNIAINPIPSEPLPVDSGPVLINVTNLAYFPNINISATLAGIKTPIGTSGAESWGIGAFKATTPGVYEYFCHYHVSNGMFGYLIVLPNSYCNANPSSCS